MKNEIRPLAIPKRKVVLSFRFANKEDSSFFYNLILNDPISARKLGLNGVEENIFDSSQYKVSIVGMDRERPVAFMKMLGGCINGFNYLELLYVMEDYRHDGVGSQMFDFIEKYSRKNWNAVGIDVFTIENIEMDQFLEKHGFLVANEDSHAYFLNGRFLKQKRYIKLYGEAGK